MSKGPSDILRSAAPDRRPPNHLRLRPPPRAELKPSSPVPTFRTPRSIAATSFRGRRKVRAPANLRLECRFRSEVPDRFCRASGISDRRHQCGEFEVPISLGRTLVIGTSNQGRTGKPYSCTFDSKVRKRRGRANVGIGALASLAAALIVPNDLAASAFKQADGLALAGVEDGNDQMWTGSACRTKNGALVIFDSAV